MFLGKPQKSIFFYSGPATGARGDKGRASKKKITFFEARKLYAEYVTLLFYGQYFCCFIALSLHFACYKFPPTSNILLLDPEENFSVQDRF